MTTADISALIADLSAPDVDTIFVSPEEFAKVQAELAAPHKPSPGAIRGAEMLAGLKARMGERG